MDKEKGTCIGVIVCRLEPHGQTARNRGYIAMLAVSKEYRKRKIGSTLVLMAIEAMKSAGADEVKKNIFKTHHGSDMHHTWRGRNIIHFLFF